ncbi:hypothetical protein JAAARDRAFT_190652 [Jaapia argillacea MUCL 33604]|uniref:Uncharacterized protein n=1 Tax=Jaapia argillacea MUCL 33604 TaxID=933084 RepID=A0A067Q4I0_9AGAM|nr:hypothetical protein JAAARDRAFT_190652 [Jaapia argillacea MUCL 33604]
MPLQINNAAVIDDVPVDARTHLGDSPKKTKHNPLINAFVALSIDPVATVRALEDPVAVAEAEKLPCKTYVGLIDDYYGLPGPYDPFTETSICLVGQGLPPHSEEYFSQPSMSIPLSPGAEHPLGRDPLKLTNLLPWPNCYVYTCSTVKARIRSAPYDDGLIVSKISDNRDWWRKNYFITMDDDTQQDLRNVSRSLIHVVETTSAHDTQTSTDAGPDWQAVYAQLATPHRAQDAEIQSCAVSRGDSTSWSLDSSSDIDASKDDHMMGVMAAMLSLNSTPSVLTVVDAWYDLSRVTTIPDPRGFLEERKALDEIKRASKKRLRPWMVAQNELWEKEQSLRKEWFAAALNAPEPPPLPVVDEADRTDISQSSSNEIVEQNSGSAGSDGAVVAHSPVPLPDCEAVQRHTQTRSLDSVAQGGLGLNPSADPEDCHEDRNPRPQGVKRSTTDLDVVDEHSSKKTRLDVPRIAIARAEGSQIAVPKREIMRRKKTLHVKSWIPDRLSSAYHRFQTGLRHFKAVTAVSDGLFLST